MARNSSLSANEIASLSLHGPNLQIQLDQTQHRIDIISNWPIFEGAKVLELGCGQGDCTTVLAELVGPNGHVTAIDPAPLDYGAPATLGQAQGHISSGRLGERITWTRADPLQFLQSADTEKYDIGVLAHSIWYFSSPELIIATLRHLASRVQTICLAEWSLNSANPGAHTHVLAALTQAALECRKPESLSNVRTVVSPSSIKEMAKTAGLVLESEALITPSLGVLDGKWEVGAVLSKYFLKEVEEHVKDDRERGVVLALRDAVEASVVQAGGKDKVAPMDVWSGVFTPAPEVK